MGAFYKNASSIDIDTSLLDSLRDAIYEREPYFPTYQLDSISKKEMIGLVRLFMSNFRLKKITIIKGSVDGHIKENRIKLSNDSIFNVPIKFNLSNPTDGYVYQIVKKDKEILVESISLPKVSTIFSASTYVHEIVHTHVNVYKGNIKYAFNDEVMTCLLEFLFLLSKYGNKESFNADYQCRLIDIRKYIDIIRSHEEGLNIISDDIYDEYFTNVVSFIQALGLVNLYRFNNISFKKGMLKRIQLVLSGDIMVEDLLDYYDINLNTLLCDNSFKALKK